MEVEYLAAVWAMEKAKYFLLGCQSFLLATDHNPLLGIFSDDKSIKDVENPRLQRLKEKTLRFRASCQFDCIFSKPTQQEIQQSLDIEQEVHYEQTWGIAQYLQNSHVN